MPNGVTVAGTPGPIRISEQRYVSRTDAPELHETYRGERVATFSAFGLLVVNAAHASYRQEGASATIDRVFKDETAYVDTVEIDFNAVQREWFYAPVYSGLTVNDVWAVEGAIQELNKYASEEHTYAEVKSKRQQLAVRLALGDGAQLLADAFNDIRLNGLSFTALLPVVTFTRNVAPGWPTPFVIADMGKLFTTAGVLSSVPANAQWGIIEVTGTLAANSLQTLAWFKTGRYGVSSDGGAQYVQQYIFDAYPTNRYVFA